MARRNDEGGTGGRSVPGTGRCLHPFFAYGDLVEDGPLAWVLAGSASEPARVRGRLWRLPSGEIRLEPRGRGAWVQGRLHAPLSPRRMILVQQVLAGAARSPGSPAARLEVVYARTGGGARRVALFAVDEKAARRLGSRPLSTRDSGRWR